MNDPQIKKIKDIQSFLKLFCSNDTFVCQITDWLIATDGRYVTILLDGYDKTFFGGNKSDSIIEDITDRKVLRECGLIITSYPSASPLHDIVDCQVRVLGFTEEDRLSFLQHAMQNSDKIDQLRRYLRDNPFIDKLCYAPVNLSILLSLVEGGICTLPKSQTDFFGNFIITAIFHFLKQNDAWIIPDKASLDSIPHPYDQVIKELSQLAYNILLNNQVSFTKAEVNAVCSLAQVKYNGLGLLKPVEYFRVKNNCEQELFSFIHFPIQEYLAAYYIVLLPNIDLSNLLNSSFWKLCYLNTWRMCVSIAGSKHHVLKNLILTDICLPIGSRSNISNKVILNKLQHLYLLYCMFLRSCSFCRALALQCFLSRQKSKSWQSIFIK